MASLEARVAAYVQKLETSPSVVKARTMLQRVDTQYMPVIVSSWQKHGLSVRFIESVALHLRRR
jgi:hypothetical protein